MFFIKMYVIKNLEITLAYQGIQITLKVNATLEDSKRFFVEVLVK